MKYISLGKYSDMNTFIHKMNPKAKVISFFILILSASSVTNPVGVVLIFVFSCLTIVLSRIPIKYIWKRLYVPVFLIVFMFLILLISFTGNPIYSFGPLYMTKEGIEFSKMILLRSLSCLFFAFILFETTRFEKIIYVLYYFRIPNILIQILMLSYRYIFVLLNELAGMFNAAVAKGFSPKLTIKNLTVFGNMIGMLLIKSYERGDRVYYSMVSKGYTGKTNIGNIEKMKWKDYFLMTIMILFAVGIHIPLLCSLTII